MRRRIDSGFGRCLANVSCERIRRGTGRRRGGVVWQTALHAQKIREAPVHRGFTADRRFGRCGELIIAEDVRCVKSQRWPAADSCCASVIEDFGVLEHAAEHGVGVLAVPGEHVG